MTLRLRATYGTPLGGSREHFDWALFLSASMLAVIGVVNLYSATSVARASLSEVYIQQVYWLVLGGILGTLVCVIDYRHYERLGYALYGFGVILLILVFILGRDIRGSSRWIYIGSFSLQPSEFMKLFLVIALAKYFHDDTKNEGRTLWNLLVPALLTTVPTLLVLMQPDLGTALILSLLFVTVCAMTKIQGKSLLWLLGGLALFGVLGGTVLLPLLWDHILKDYQKLRITAFLNPETNIHGMNWHAHNARIAIGNGGILGQGFMRGSQNQFLFLPDQYTDFPFPVFAEDWGFFGCLLLIALYLFLVLWSIRIASIAKDRFGAALAIGVGGLLFWHVVFNLGMATGILPVVGVTLPLFSYGGSSVVTVALGIGLLMNVSMRRYSG